MEDKLKKGPCDTCDGCSSTSACASISALGRCPLEYDTFLSKETIDEMTDNISHDCEDEINRQFEQIMSERNNTTDDESMADFVRNLPGGHSYSDGENWLTIKEDTLAELLSEFINRQKETIEEGNVFLYKHGFDDCKEAMMQNAIEITPFNKAHFVAYFWIGGRKDVLMIEGPQELFNNIEINNKYKLAIIKED